MPKAPDFWLIECDTFWHDLGVTAVACTVVAGPEAMIENYDGKQWLVRVTPPVTDHGVTTELVLVDDDPLEHRPHGDGWRLWCTGVYSLQPWVSDVRRTFSITETIGGHKMTVTTVIE